jgi:hypothetical protein
MKQPSQTRWSGVAVILLGLVCNVAWADVSDDDAVRAAVLDYAEGWATGDAERMARALHPQASRRRVVADVLTGEFRVQVMDAATLLRATRDGAGKDVAEGPLNLRVAILDRHGDMATARVVSALYVDYLQLARWEDRWVVLSVLWGTISAPGE